MKRRRNIVIVSLVCALVACLVGFGIYNALLDENALSINEKKWIDNNNADVVSVIVPNDIPVFGDTGEGVFFDFVNYMKDDTKLKFNNNTVSYLSVNEGYRFEISSHYDINGLLLYKDHFVLVSKNTGLINDPDTIPSLNVAVISSSLEQVVEYFDGFIDLHYILESEIESIRSDYHTKD